MRRAKMLWAVAPAVVVAGAWGVQAAKAAAGKAAAETAAKLKAAE